MRTTIEITDEQRAKVLQIAAARGEVGFSAVVRDAIDSYLIRQSGREARIQAALKLRGKLRQAEADDLESAIRALRDTWR